MSCVKLNFIEFNLSFGYFMKVEINWTKVIEVRVFIVGMIVGCMNNTSRRLKLCVN